MPVRFPTKYHGGFSGVGSQLAAYLDSSPGGDWQRKRSSDWKTVAEREGNHLHVRTKPPEGVTTRIYMAGHNAAGQELVWGTRNLRSWTLLGPAVLSTVNPNTLPLFNHYGHGRVGQIGVDGSAGTWDVDAHNLLWWNAVVNIRTTRDGVGPLQPGSIDVPASMPTGVWVGATQVGPVGAYTLQAPPGYWGTKALPVYYSGLAITQFDAAASQAKHRFICIDGSEGRVLGDTISPPNTAPFGCWLNTLSPGRLLKMDTFYHPPNFPAWATYPRHLLAEGFHSTDAGRTWATVPLSIILAELNSLLSLSHTNYFTVSQVYPPKLLTAPLSRVESVVVATTPYAVGTSLAGWRIKMGLVGEDGEPTHRTMIRESSDFGVHSAVRQILPVEGGVLIVLRRAVGPWSNRAEILFTSDGINTVLIGEMPDVERACSSIMPISPTTLLVVTRAADKAFLERSDNRGATWVRIAQIADGIYPPGGAGSEYSPPDFASIAYVLRNGRPMSSTPSAPWLTDCRITHG